MRIKVTDIQDEGLDLSYRETSQDLDLAFPDANFQGPIQTEAQLSRVDETVMVSGKVRSSLLLDCGRCGCQYSLPLHLDFKSIFSPGLGDSEGPQANESGGPGEGSSYHYSDQTIDMGEFVREQILLALPMVPLCRPDCLGFCMICKQNRNIKECGCNSEENNGPSKT